MVWTFYDPHLIAADGNVDAGCIHGVDYADGGFCVGVKYTNTTPKFWAVWFTDDDFNGWN